ncbi:hypothetical protein acsn021_35120 [Anaerocolumna cellulosilytica]|uniref:Uncharacterized protein n=1 Tax=Anaerocolumna cellulosilytica TaxID=433286 RepID=A0A6S6QXL1_9FIRM|nr:hypothetical protein [Anaerocolumna cellulosilytica]MBB5195412.1 hypothetical protein [Anaerocolumna cellulosilytica]BCJ95943.1 hypothetical protein acsn021_35120 [Anaerocolumna cellulosilytica]
MNENNDSTIDSRASVERKHAVAKIHARNHATEFTKDMMVKLNQEKLGYLKGSKVEVEMKANKYIDEITSGDSDIRLRGNSYVNMVKFLSNQDPSLKISCNYHPDDKKNEYTITITLEKAENIHTKGNMPLKININYAYATWSKYGAWYRENDIFGDTSVETLGQLTNFEKAPVLEIDSVKEYTTNLDLIVKPDQLYNVKSHAGNVNSKYLNNPDFSLLGEQKATIHVWDEYGEKTPSDIEHYKTFDVRLKLIDITTFKSNSLNKWEYFENPSIEIKFIQGSNNSLTDNISLFSPSLISLIKFYKFIKGAKYKFTVFIKPENENEVGIIRINLDSKFNQRVLLEESTNHLPPVQNQYKGFKEVSTVFTVMDNEVNSELIFSYISHTGIYIDSLRIEQV